MLQDGEVSADEFKKAIQTNCVGKSYADFPGALKSFVDTIFRSIDVDGNFLPWKNLHGVFFWCTQGQVE